MIEKAVATLLLATICAHAQNQCRNPTVEKRLLADDARFASPFYVVALPKTSETAEIDNVCYTYFEDGKNPFDHIISVTFRDGRNKYHRYTKGDISNQMGLAEAKAADASCTYHDYTLVPICNATVFTLYRCYIEGECTNIDIGPNLEVDNRVVLAATPSVSQECYKEIEKNLKNTSFFKGGDYSFLPQSLIPQCVTKFNNKTSIGDKRAVGSKDVTEDINIINRFGNNEDKRDPIQINSIPKYPNQYPKPPQASWHNQNTYVKNPTVIQGIPQIPYKQQTGSVFHQTSVLGPGFTSSYVFSQAIPNHQGYQPAHIWVPSKWNVGPSSWVQPGEVQYQPWQGHSLGYQQPPHLPTTPNTWQGHNFFYTWEKPPSGC